MLSLLIAIALCSRASHSSTDCHDYFECESQTLTGLTNCYGFGSCAFASISTQDAVHCDGAHSCHATSIESDGSIYCRSIASCNKATLTSASQLYCEGVASCADAYIESNGKISAHGHYGAAVSRITGASTVRAYGYYALLYSTVDSGDNSEMSVKLYGVDAGYGANIVCQSGATCALACKAGGCMETDFICLYGASCSVSPEQCLEDNSVEEYDGITCPEWKVSESADDDEAFSEYMELKESEKEDNVKWKLYESYTSDDMESFAAIIEETKESKAMHVVLAVHGVNVYSYLVGSIVAIVLIGCICAMKRYNEHVHRHQYQKV